MEINFISQLCRNLLAQFLLFLGFILFQTPASSCAKTLSWTAPGDRIDERALKPFRATGNEIAESPDWLSREDVLDLLGGNTITALNKNGTIRWWAYYSNSRPFQKEIIWQNDRGKSRIGIWHVSEEGALCVRWESPLESCKRVRISGRTVRFDDHINGKPSVAVVLYPDDHKNLARKALP